MKQAMSVVTMICATTSVASGEVIEREFPMKPGGKLELNLQTGATLDILGWEEAKIRVVAHLRGEDKELTKVEFDPSADGLEIRSFYTEHRPRLSTDHTFEIRVPSRFNLEIESLGGGITLRNLEGEVHGATAGGPLDFQQLKGDVEFVTAGGEIRLLDSEVDGILQSYGGKVVLAGVEGDVDGISGVGKLAVRVSGNGTAQAGRGAGAQPGSARSATTASTPAVEHPARELDEEDAKAVLKAAPARGYRITEPRRGVTLDSSGGSIRLAAVRDFARLRTLGGDVEIDALDGWASVLTYGGDVRVEMVGDPEVGRRDAELVSKNGDVSLVVPRGLDMDIEIELAYTESSSQDFQIFSDFPLELEETDSWSHDRGSPRKYIYGKGAVGSGGHRIRLKTINGNVYLRSDG